MRFLTDFADQAVILPLVVTTALGLWFGGWQRATLAWLMVTAVTLGAVGLGKVAVFVWGAPASLPLLLSPSGHTASAPLIYGGLAMLLLPRRWSRALGLPLAVLFCAAIGVTRVGLGEHSVPDVWAGAAIGLAGSLALHAAIGAKPYDFRPWALIGLGVAAIAGFHGLRMPAETWLRALADILRPD
ncbi:MAG: phosphatase PAP2 family protein [Alphaproteobacteria bacterium]|nr:phosphatase PAP2 family protein [Alphaproteobacteria bacterium]